MSDVTKLLKAASEGDLQAQNELYRLTKPELQKLAWYWIRRYQAKGHMRTTEVIDRAFLKVMRSPSPDWQHRGHFYKFASPNICYVVIDLLRERIRSHRILRHSSILPKGDDPESVADELDSLPAPAGPLSLHTLLTLREALEDLGRDLSQEHRVVVELLILWECTLDEVAEVLSISRDKAFRMNRIARKYLRDKLSPSFPDLA